MNRGSKATPLESRALRCLVVLVILVVLLLGGGLIPPAFAQRQPSTPPSTPSTQKDAEVMLQMSRSIQDLAKRVSPAVVEVLVTGYGSPSDEDEKASSALGRERALGSGVIVDPDGYIVTNAHVVEGAERIRV